MSGHGGGPTSAPNSSSGPEAKTPGGRQAGAARPDRRASPGRGAPRSRTDSTADHRPHGCHQRQDLADRTGKDLWPGLARYAAALGGRLHQAIYFDDGDIAAIACPRPDRPDVRRDGVVGRSGRVLTQGFALVTGSWRRATTVLPVAMTLPAVVAMRWRRWRRHLWGSSGDWARRFVLFDPHAR